MNKVLKQNLTILAFYIFGFLITLYFIYDIKFLFSWKKTILTLFKATFWPYYWAIQLFNTPTGLIVMTCVFALAWIVGKIRERF